jgi:uncharacterized protein involved in tolerance to divalent cations
MLFTDCTEMVRVAACKRCIAERNGVCQKRHQRCMQKETSALVAEIVDLDRHSAAAAKQTTHLTTPSDIDTDSDSGEEEYQHWIRRELARVKREEAMRDPSAQLAARQVAAASCGPSVRPSVVLFCLQTTACCKWRPTGTCMLASLGLVGERVELRSLGTLCIKGSSTRQRQRRSPHVSSAMATSPASPRPP